MTIHDRTSKAENQQQDSPKRCFPRREFLGRSIVLGGTAGLAAWTRVAGSATRSTGLEIGHGVVDTTPPVGIEMAGFHRSPGNERRITGIRKSTAARALLLKHGSEQAVIVSLDICGVSREFAAGLQRSVAERVDVPAANVRISATHTHSMPTFKYFRQWGAISPEYMAQVHRQVVQAVEMAKDDLAPGELHFGRAGVLGGNFNRTTSNWKTDEQFGQDSDDSERWLDTTVGVLLFERQGKPSLAWYHFSAHPVCYTDDNAGPDWPGLVDEMLRGRDKLQPSFLQGHCGDVNPGDGKPWLGVPEKVAEAVYAGVRQAIQRAKPVKIDSLAVRNAQVPLPLDVSLFKARLEQYQKDPAKCNSGNYVDARFAADWATSAAKWDPRQTSLAVPVSTLQLGGIGMLFHPAELYSCYGLIIQRDSPTDHTLVVGYSDDLIGYLPDPAAYEAGEYAALTVPGILDLPPFTPQAGRDFTTASLKLLECHADHSAYAQ